MSLNYDKTKLLVVGTKTMCDRLNVCDVVINGFVVSPLKFIKCLGVYIDCTLSWVPHINYVTKKINCNLHFVQNLKFVLDTYHKILLVNAICLPLINYALLAWGSAANNNLKPIIKSFRTAARICLNKSKYDNISDSITTELKWMYPTTLFDYKLLCLMHTLIYDQCPEMLKSIVNLRVRNGRNGVKLQSNNVAKNKYGERLLDVLGSQKFNSLTPEIRNDDVYLCYRLKIYDYLMSLQNL